MPYSVDNKTASAPVAVACPISNLTNEGHYADWLIGVFDLGTTPRWGGAAAGRLAVPAVRTQPIPTTTVLTIGVVCVEVLIACMRLLQGYTHAVMIQNQDENRNVSVNYNILSSTPTTKHNIFGLCRTEFDLF